MPEGKSRSIPNAWQSDEEIAAALTWHERPLPLERELVDIAAAAAGMNGVGHKRHPVIVSLDGFAEARTHPGPVRAGDRDLLLEAAEELADCRNYLAWAAALARPGLLAGDHEATRRYDQAMRSLAAVTIAWRELFTSSA